MKIGVYASARNEEKNLPDWLASVEDADVVAINDTGSSDDTYRLLCDAAARSGLHLSVSQIPIESMWLANALNTAMGELPDYVDLAIRLDLDERLQPGWRDTLERAPIAGPMILRPWFDHHGCLYRHTRVHSRHGFRWELPVHEQLVGDVPHIVADTELTIEHHQDPTKDRSQVLDELVAAHAADPTNLRLLHYLGREYTYRGRWVAALQLLVEHGVSDAIIEERAESWILAGDAAAALGADPLVHYERAAVTAPQRREPWVKLAMTHRAASRWSAALAAAETALRITERNWYLNQPYAWGPLPHDEAALATQHLGRPHDALRHGQAALDIAPDDPRLRANLDWYRTLVS